jgi:hypothetical protein
MAFIGKMFFERGDGASPEGFARVCQVFSISGLGKTKTLVDVTTFCSNGTREYIPGLADGQEMTIEANYEIGDPNLANLMADADSDTNKNYRVVVGEGSPTTVFSFAGVPLSWVVNPSVDNRNTITFTIKISGDITVTG